MAGARLGLSDNRPRRLTGVSELLLLERSRLTWQQVTYHTSGWRQWMTEQTTNDGRPIAEIIEVGPASGWGSHHVRYALESEGETRLYESLDEAIRAAELLGSVTPQDVAEVTTMLPPV